MSSDTSSEPIEHASLAKTAISDEVAVEFKHVTKTYKLYKNERSRFLGIFNYRKKGEYLGMVHANDDLSFSVRKGEAIALIGPNGAGKSTALKLVTGVSYPSSGQVIVNGRVSALLELNAGFDGQLTGRENLRLRSKVLGMKSAEFKLVEEEIIEFADLGLYIDQPMKMYSSGMKARLGFAFVACIDPDILVVDEALSVGDKKFKRKCVDRMRKIMSSDDVTVLFVTHESSAAQEFCTRGIVLSKGRKMFDGPIDDAIEFYDASCEGA